MEPVPVIVMNMRPFNRIMLLLPVLGIIIAAFFVSMPAASAQPAHGAVRITFQAPDHELNVPQTYTHTQIPEQRICLARKFYSRGRAIAPISGLGSVVLIGVRAAQLTGLYVLHHPEAREEVPTSSQYGYLFLLTPF